MTEIQKTTAALRTNQLEIDKCFDKYGCNNHTRLVRLSDKRWDLEARYEMQLRQAGLTRP